MVYSFKVLRDESRPVDSEIVACTGMIFVPISTDERGRLKFAHSAAHGKEIPVIDSVLVERRVLAEVGSIIRGRGWEERIPIEGVEVTVTPISCFDEIPGPTRTKI